MSHSIPAIGIISTGNMGATLACMLAKKNIRAVLSDILGEESLSEIVSSLDSGIRTGTRKEAAAQQIVLVSVKWSELPAALAGIPNFGGRIVIDANNPIEAPLFRPIPLNGRSSSEVFAELVPGARVVKAFNHLTPQLLAADPDEHGGRRVLFFAGDDAQAKSQIARLIELLGFAGVDLGSLAEGGRMTQFPGGPLPSLELVQFN